MRLLFVEMLIFTKGLSCKNRFKAKQIWNQTKSVFLHQYTDSIRIFGDKIASEGLLVGGIYPFDKHDLQTWSFPKVGVKKKTNKSLKPPPRMGKCLIMPNHAALKLEANLSLSFQPWFPPNKHKSPFLNSTHEHTLVDITILESDTAIFLKPDFNITSIYCFVPLLHCRLDLKAISANARAWSIYDSCWFVSKLSSESSAFGGISALPPRFQSLLILRNLLTHHHIRMAHEEP